MITTYELCVENYIENMLMKKGKSASDPFVLTAEKLAGIESDWQLVEVLVCPDIMTVL
jgi:hypothetical protein